MRIWTFNHYASTPDEQMTAPFDIAKALVRKGHEVTIFASSFSHYKFLELKLRKSETWQVEVLDGVRFVWVRTFPYCRNDWRRILNMASFAWRTWRVSKKLSDSPDVIVGVTVHPLAALTGACLAKKYNVPFVYEVRDLWPLTLIEFGRISARGPLAFGLIWLERITAKRATAIVTTMPGGPDHFEKLGIPRRITKWIPNGLDISRFDTLKPYDGTLSKCVTFMYIGGHVYALALEVILRASQVIERRGERDVRFVFVGGGQERQHLIRLAQNLGLRRVEFRGVVPKAELPQIMQEADAFLVSMRDRPALYQHGISFNKLCDYMAAGRPIIFAGNPGYNAVEKAQAGIVVPPERPEAIVKAIEQFLALTPEERRQMGQNGQRYVKEHHDIRILTDKMEAVLLAAVSEHGGPSAERVKAAPSRPPDQSELHEVARGGSKNGQ